MSHSNSNSGGCLPGIIIFLIICYIIGAVSDSGKHTCYYIGCDREVDKNETYCWYHKDYGHRKSYNVTTQTTTESNYHKQSSSYKTKKKATYKPEPNTTEKQQHPVIINIPVLHPIILRQLKPLILRMFTTPTMMDMMTYMTIWEITMKIDMMKMTIIGTV